MRPIQATMAFYNFGNSEQDFHSPQRDSPLLIFRESDGDDDYVYAFVDAIDDEDLNRRAPKRRRQATADPTGRPSRRRQRTVSEYQEYPPRDRSLETRLREVPANDTFAPRFDIRETRSAYLLYGELPGIDPKDIDLAFADPKTLQIKGTVSRHFGPPDDAGNEDEGTSSDGDDSDDEDGEHSSDSGSGSDSNASSDNDTHASNDSDSDTSSDLRELTAFLAGIQSDSDTASERTDDERRSRQATVEELDDEGNVISIQRATRPFAEAERIIAHGDRTQGEASDRRHRKVPREWNYLMNERNIGRFSRQFNFPQEVDQDKVRAKLDRGLLTIAVPKLVERRRRRIVIE
ncbi:hypothetical protein KEM52_000494 [Ascosphaera acerosa]|nr:hypothetical protein KEM52_000494 [Ascosphaera acerosa]